jgi:hypothetical protein
MAETAAENTEMRPWGLSWNRSYAAAWSVSDSPIALDVLASARNSDTMRESRRKHMCWLAPPEESEDDAAAETAELSSCAAADGWG